MKKILILIILCLSFLISPTYAELNEDDFEEQVLQSGNKLINLFNSLKSPNSSEQNTLLDQGESLKCLVNKLNESSPYKTTTNISIINNTDTDIQKELLTSNESIFLTGIRGDFYENQKDVPISIQYSHIRSSDGAVFSGTLLYYYLRYGYIGPMPYTEYFQYFYEGTLYFLCYAY